MIILLLIMECCILLKKETNYKRRIILSIKEESFTVPVNGKAKNYDGWCITCDQKGCKNAIIVSEQVIPDDYVNQSQLDNGTFQVPWNDVENESDLSDHLYDNTDWRIDEDSKVWCPEHSQSE